MQVNDVDQAVAFFTGILGFTVGFRFEDYAYVYRETVGIRMLQIFR
ncbi:MAG TPA: VOC family protein [Candidatus Bathyarchaeia archaeon]|nr:VOC family protein [Candidatus Bathyarchaeia archaeon]